MFWMYAGFILLVLMLLALDLLFATFIHVGYDRHWMGLGLTEDHMGAAPVQVEGVGLVYNKGASATVKYITGYVVEKSLAVDNIFVIAMLFGFFAVPPFTNTAYCSGESSAPS